jgi:hypothetical protein
MTANPEHESRSAARCWCRVTRRSDENLVHLGEQPGLASAWDAHGGCIRVRMSATTSTPIDGSQAACRNPDRADSGDQEGMASARRPS